MAMKDGLYKKLVTGQALDRTETKKTLDAESVMALRQSASMTSLSSLDDKKEATGNYTCRQVQIMSL